MKLLVTGGCGFIGSNFIRHVLRVPRRRRLGRQPGQADLRRQPREPLRRRSDRPNYRFVRGDIVDADVGRLAMEGCTTPSSTSPPRRTSTARSSATRPSSRPTCRASSCCSRRRRRRGVKRFVQISTDEVYGSIAGGLVHGGVAARPAQPVRGVEGRRRPARVLLLGVPTACRWSITRASNNYGPYQYPEKLIPLFVTNAIDDLPLPLYGDGRNVRDWLFVRDHCGGHRFPARRGQGRGDLQRRRRQRARERRRSPAASCSGARQAREPDPLRGRPARPRPPLLPGRLQARAPGLQPTTPFEQGLTETIRWYRDHEEWWRPIKEKDAAFGSSTRRSTPIGSRRRLESTAKEPGLRRKP